MKSTLAGILISILLLASLALSGCSRAGSSMNGSGTLIDQDIKLTDFTGVSVNGPFNADLVQTDAFQVIVNTDENLTNRVQATLNDGTLVVGIEAPATFFPSSLKIKIGMPRLYKLTLSGGAKATLTGFKSTFNLGLVSSDGSTLSGSLDAGNCDFNISDSSQVNLKGSALGLDLTASGTSKLNLAAFAVNTAKLNLSQGSEATLNLNGRTDVRLADASKIYYTGNPTFNNTLISGGSFMKHQ